jgi:hypothetical protein
MRCKVTIFFVFLSIEFEKYTAQEALKIILSHEHRRNN